MDHRPPRDVSHRARCRLGSPRMMERINVIRNKITSITSLANTKNYAYTLYLRLTPYEKEILEKAVGNDQCLSFLPEGCNCVECLARDEPPNPQIEAVAGLLFLRWYVPTCTYMARNQLTSPSHQVLCSLRSSARTLRARRTRHGR
jgi:hypothetical protein